MIAALGLALLQTQTTATFTFPFDTFLDRTQPAANYGREPFLKAGPDQVILIKFPEVGFVDDEITSASLVLTLIRGANVNLERIGRVKRWWGEGGGKSNPSDVTAIPTAVAGEASWQYAIAGDRSIRWSKSGAQGDGDVDWFSGAILQASSNKVVIAGLGPLIKEIAGDRSGDYGLAIQFSDPVTFVSGDSPMGGPELAVTTQASSADGKPDLQVVSLEPNNFDPANPPSDGQTVTWTAVVKNVGSTVSGAQRVSWRYRGRLVESNNFQNEVEPGGTAQFRFRSTWRNDAADHSLDPIGFSVIPVEGDMHLSDNSTVVHLTAVPMSFDTPVSLKDVDHLNEVVFPKSRSSLANRGIIERVRIATKPESAVFSMGASEFSYKTVISTLSGLKGSWGRPLNGGEATISGQKVPQYNTGDFVGVVADTRDDGFWPSGLPLPDYQSSSRFVMDLPIPEREMVSRTEALRINEQIGVPSSGRSAMLGRISSNILLRAWGFDGVPVRGSKVEIFQTDGTTISPNPFFTGTTDNLGSVLVTSRQTLLGSRPNPFGDLKSDGSNSWALVRFSAHGVQRLAWLSATQLMDEYERGNRAAGFVEFRIELPSGAIDRTQDLAKGRLVTDSASSFPAQLVAIADGDPKTSFEVKAASPGYWIEIDLGRDRQIGEIVIEFDGEVWNEFLVSSHKTSQSPDVAQVWADVNNGTTRVKEENGLSTIALTAQTVRSRYIRLISKNSSPVKIASIKVYPLRASG